MKRFIGLFALIGLSWALAAPASADSRVHVGLNSPVLKVAGFNNNRRSFRNRGFVNRGFNNRRFNNRGFNNRGFNSRRFNNRGFNNGSIVGFGLGLGLGLSTGNAYSGSRYNNNSYSSGYSGNSCQRVSKRGYWNDRPALIGGRQCIDRDGYSYIVPDSRHLIRYY